jgi:hypothetical protein
MKQRVIRHRRKIQNAAKLYENFTGDAPRYVEAVRLETPDVVLLVGEMDAVLYSCYRDGKLEHYKHTFRKSSRPLLVSNSDGTALFIVGGRYSFTDRGIVDR